MSDCIFCKIISQEIPAHIIYEDDRVLAFLDIAPVNPGHTLLIPKEHYMDFQQAPGEILVYLVTIAHKIAPAIIGAVGAEAFNLTTNVGENAGQVVSHLHWHMMPRFADDGYQLWHGKPYNDGEDLLIKNAIISRLQ